MSASSVTSAQAPLEQYKPPTNVSHDCFIKRNQTYCTFSNYDLIKSNILTKNCILKRKKSALAMFYHCLEITNIFCTSNKKNVVKEDMKPLSFWVFCLLIRLTIALTSESAIHYVSIHTLSS